MVLREGDLAKEFSISRTPIRQVLSTLEHDRLVEVRHGVGNIVTHVHPQQMVEVYTVRMVLAQSAGDYFVAPFPEETAQKFVDYREAFQALKPGDVIGFGHTNIRYYLGLTDLVTNACMRDLQRALFFQTSRMWLISLPSQDWAEVIAAVSDEMDELIRVIRLDDPIGLGLAARNHIFMSRRRILAALDVDAGERRNPI